MSAYYYIYVSLYYYICVLMLLYTCGAGTSTQSTYWALFEISIKLTEEGLTHYMEIVDIVFSYIQNCLRKSSDEARQAIRTGPEDTYIVV